MCFSTVTPVFEGGIFPPDLVLRVNEVYHDVEGRRYQDIHPEIFVDEGRRWERFGKHLGQQPLGITILDIGTGTGFVPLTIGEFLKETDTVICSDISERMLSVCEENVLRENFKCNFEFLKLDGRKIHLGSKVDYILLNSVLHHIPDLEEFFLEANRALKVNGQIIMAHEPNKSFYSHSFLWNNYRMVSLFAAPKDFVASVLRRLGLMEHARRLYSILSNRGREQGRIMQEVNDILLKEGVIKTPLTSSQITEIVDIHSPTAGGHHKDRGIDVKMIMEDYIPYFTLVRLETYNYLCDLSSRSRLTRKYEEFLKKRYPGKGSTIFAVMRKERETRH